MNQEEQIGWQERILSRWRPLLWIGSLVALILIVVGGGIFGWTWTGFNGRTLWDWLKLLLAVAVPIVIAYLGQRISTAQYQGQQEAEENRAQDEALQAYLDQMSQLLTDKDRPLHRATPGDSLSTLARARTLTVLVRVDGDRKGHIVQFLYEAGLLTRFANRFYDPIVSLAGADLSGANLRAAHLTAAVLGTSQPGLREALLGKWRPARQQESIVVRTDMRSADMRFSDLSSCHLADIDFDGANLASADLEGANLYRASLEYTYLQGTVLRNANLLSAMGKTNAALEQAAHLEGATMPNGQKYEDWLKDREGRE